MPKSEETYSLWYDLFTDTEHDQDDVISMLTQADELLGRAPRLALEIGCGTGRHAVHVGPRVDQLMAIDPSDSQIAICERKLAAAMANCVPDGRAAYACRALVQDLQPLLKPGLVTSMAKFDLVYALGNVFNYVMGFQEAIDFLKCCHNAMDVGAVLVLEVWNGVAALTDPARPERKVKPFAAVNVFRDLKCETDLMKQTARLEYTFSTPGVEPERWPFEHRLWTPNEIDNLLWLTGFLPGPWTAPFKFDAPAQLHHRWIMTVARALDSSEIQC